MALHLEVLPDEQRPARLLSRRGVPPVPWSTLPAEADLTLATTWRSVPEAPPLSPTSFVADVFQGPLQVADHGDAWVVRFPAHPPGTTQHLSVDPDGLRAAWWRFTLTDDGVRTQRCGLDTLDPTFPGPAPTASARCDDVARPAVHDETGRWIVRAPGIDGRRRTTASRMQWSVDGPAAGTWSANGRTLPHRMEAARPIAAEGLPVRAMVTPDGASWTLDVASTEDGMSGPLAWTLYRYGKAVRQGRLTLDADGTAHRAFAAVAPGVLLMELRQEATPLDRTFLTAVRPVQTNVALASGVQDGAVWLTYDTSRGVDLRVVATTGDGLRLDGQTTLPRGQGLVRVDLPDGTMPVRIEAPPYLSARPLWTTP